MSPEDGEDNDEVASMYNRDEKVGPGDVPGPSDDDQSGDSTSQGDGIDAPIIDPGNDEQEEATGTFYVKYAQEKSVTLHEVNTTQIYTLVENPGLERHEILEARLISQPPMGVSYLIDELEAQYTVPVETSPEQPTQQIRDIANEELSVGDALAIEREGKGEIHILSVEPEQTATAIEEIQDDEMTFKNAARYDEVERVQIRSDSDEGVVSIRYLP